MKIRGMTIGRRLRVPGLFVLLAFLAYSPILNSFFLSDDFELIGRVVEGDTSFTWGLAQGGFFRPLVILSFVVDSKLWGTNPTGYHLTSIALHVLNSYLVFIFAARLMRRNEQDAENSFRVSSAAGLIFLLLPSHTEAVSWISGRGDLIAVAFVLTALILYDSYRLEGSSALLAAVLVFFMGALFAKESAICLPFAVMAMELFPATERRQSVDLKRTIRIGVLLALVVVVYFLIRYAALGTLIGAYGPSQHLNFTPSLIWERLPKFAVRSILPPFPQQLAFMLFKPFKSHSFIIFAVSFTALLSTLLVLRHRWQSPIIRKRQNTLLLLLLLLFLSSLIPVITMGISVFDTAGERFVYLPSVFSVIALAYISTIFIANRKLWMLAVFCLVTFYAASLYSSNQRWREAANLTKSILNDLRILSKNDDLLIINAPSDLRGVPVYQNGLEQALKTFQAGRKVGRVDVVARHNLQSTADKIEVTQELNRFSVRLINEKAEFSRVNDQIRCVGVADRTKTSLAILLNDCAQGTDVFFFSEGKMIRVPEVQGDSEAMTITNPRSSIPRKAQTSFSLKCQRRRSRSRATIRAW